MTDLLWLDGLGRLVSIAAVVLTFGYLAVVLLASELELFRARRARRRATTRSPTASGNLPEAGELTSPR